MKLEEIFNTVTANESREMTFERFKQAIEMLKSKKKCDFDNTLKQKMQVNCVNCIDYANLTGTQKCLTCIDYCNFRQKLN